MSEQRGNAEAKQWKELVTRLPGVLGAEFSLENGAIREVHILSDQSRGPKQIVRDVQSALLAKFGVELDHRIVSVAQIPRTSLAEKPLRLCCEQLELSTSREEASACVALGLGERRMAGRASGDRTAGGRTRTIAQAAVSALNQLLAPGHAFSLEEVRRTELGGRPAVLVGLLLKSGGKTEALLGACYEREDPNFSVALAVLDAANRRLATLPTAGERTDGDQPA